MSNINKKTTRVIIITQFILIAWSVGSSVLQSGPWAASVVTYTLYLVYVIYTLMSRDPLMTRLLIFSTIAGILELITDHYLVETINSLVYPGNEPMIWSSPLYMPLAWANVLMQLGYYGILLSKWKNISISSVVMAIAGGMYIPLYEHLAKDAGWWWYHQNTTMIFNAPLYVILCEGLISLSLPYLISLSLSGRTTKSILFGIVEGAWIWLSAIIAFHIAH